mmetsp:Transcript_15214/g.43521  ORF Transcript_15214/g.43521 Transcript_15214/m.43521 type:complete len:324 (-) Transcript_15214:129-1100(-)
MAHVGAEALPLIVVIPNLDFPVHACREQQVRGVREPADLLHTHRVACPSVYPLLGKVALAFVNVLGCLGPVLNPRATSVVRFLRAMEDRRDALLRLTLLSLHCLFLLLLASHLLFSGSNLHFQLPANSGLICKATPLCCRVFLFLIGLRLLFLLRVRLLDNLFRRLIARVLPLHCLGLVPDGPALLRRRLGGQEPLLAGGHDPGRICSIPEVVECEILLVKGKRTYARLLNMAQLVVNKLLFQVPLTNLQRTLQRLVESFETWVRQYPLLSRVDGKVLHLVPPEKVDCRCSVYTRQCCLDTQSSWSRRLCLWDGTPCLWSGTR